MSSGSLGAKRHDIPPRPLSRYNAPGGQWCRDHVGQCGRFSPACFCALRSRRRRPCPVKARTGRQTTPEDIARGKALTEAGDCASCHTADPAKPFAGGKRIDTPFGGIYSPNLTPDRETGLGAWSDDEFYRALRFGVARDGSRYYPAFPYPNFTKLTRQDIFAIRAYLATLTPVSNAPRAPELRWPFNYRVVMRGWNWLFFKPGILMPDQQKSAEWNRGRYLVEGVAHCGACHTPKNMFGADKRGRALGGGRVAGMFAPRLDGAERSGLKSWSVEDIAEYLQSGRNARSHAGELMSEVVVNSTSKMSDADIRAIAVYLKDLPAGAPEPKVTPPSPAQMAEGKKLYDGACIACHEDDGSGCAADLPAAARQRQPAIRRRLEHAAHHPRRRGNRDHAARAQQGIDAGLCRQDDRPADCRRDELYPQRLGQCGAAGDGGSGRESAAQVVVSRTRCSA